jgi:hypothetical protein
MVMLFAALHGCNIVGPVAYIVDGPPTKEAEFKLPDVPTVVFVDDRDSVVSPVSLRRIIADTASENLLVDQPLVRGPVLKTVIASQDAMALAARQDRKDSMMSIEKIGESVGAEQVIYVNMVSFKDTPDGFTPRPVAVCEVKVIDIVNNRRLYPEGGNQDARVVQTMIREVDPSLYSTRSSRLKVFEALALEVGQDVAKLFYKHEIRELGGNLNPR